MANTDVSERPHPPDRVAGIGRRELIVLLGGVVAAWPAAARAQRGIRRIGVLMGYADSDPIAQLRIGMFQRALRDLGWAEGHNVQVDYRWPAVDPERIRLDAAEIVKRSPDVILSSPAQVTLALKNLTTSIPIVFVNVPDPVDIGLVSSLAHPGGNMTGFTNFEHALAGKWLDLLKQMLPSLVRVGVLYSPENPAWRGRLRVIEEVAPSLGVHVTPSGASSDAEIDRAFDLFAGEGSGALIVLPSIFAARHRQTIVHRAAKRRLPAIYPFRFFVADGGLMAYGIDVNDPYRRAAGYVDRILKGEKPADLPVQAPTKYELIINLAAAKALGLEVPLTLLARADEVIE